MYCMDNLDMFHEHDARQEDMLERRPKCSDCGEHIQKDHLFDINGDLFCFDCMKANFQRDTEEYVRRE